MRTALALLAFASAPLVASASDPYGPVSIEQRPKTGVAALLVRMARLKVGMSDDDAEQALGMNHLVVRGTKGPFSCTTSFPLGSDHELTVRFDCDGRNFRLVSAELTGKNRSIARMGK